MRPGPIRPGNRVLPGLRVRARDRCFNEARANSPGKSCHTPRAGSAICTCFNEARANSPGKSDRVNAVLAAKPMLQ